MSIEPISKGRFVEKYNELSSELADLFDTDSAEEQEKFIEKYLHGSFNKIKNLSIQEEYKARDVEVFRMDFLVQHLTNIKEYDIEVFEDFKQEFKEVTYNEYFGTRFEVTICSSFVDKNLDFRKRESPDFEVERSSTIFAECTSTHLTKEKDRGLEYKIERAIKNKSRKDYASKDTVLMLEATNLSHHMAATDASLKAKNELKEHLEPKVRDSGYGSLLIFTFLFVDKDFQSAYIRIDNEEMDSELEEFLDHYYSEGDKHFDQPWFPREG